MSSHYIIRDDQSPALIIYQVNAISENFLNAFLEWNPTVIVEESSLSYILHNQIKIDAVILNQMNEEEADELISFQKPYKYFAANAYPGNLIEYLKSKSLRAVDIVAEFGLHSLKLAESLEAHFEVYIYADHTKYIHLKSGDFQKWASPGRGFRIYKPLTNALVSTKNLKAKGKDIYTVRKEGLVTIQSNLPIWIGEII